MSAIQRRWLRRLNINILSGTLQKTGNYAASLRSESRACTPPEFD